MTPRQQAVIEGRGSTTFFQTPEPVQRQSSEFFQVPETRRRLRRGIFPSPMAHIKGENSEFFQVPRPIHLSQTNVYGIYICLKQMYHSVVQTTSNFLSPKLQLYLQLFLTCFMFFNMGGGITRNFSKSQSPYRGWGDIYHYELT